jgi:hypothetical protein
VEPLGGDFEPKGAPGLTNGYPRKGGVFTMPLSEFVLVFHGLETQTTGPGTKTTLKR